MNPFLLLVAELILLFLLAGKINRSLYIFFMKLTKNTSTAVSLMSLLYLPGTIVHELAHLLVAEILRVPTGNISFTPKINEKGDRLDAQMGSVEVAKVDPVRKYLVGLAPLFFGLIALYLTVWLFQRFWPQTANYYQQAGLIIVSAYLLFSISNNMFSSQKDLEGFWVFALIMGLFLVTLYLVGVRFELTGRSLETTLIVTNHLNQTLLVVLGINIILVLLNRLIFKN
jgi:hypothetical protein